MPRGSRSVFTGTFRAKKELHCIFLGKKVFIITSKHGTTIFFSHCNPIAKKNWPKKRAYVYRVSISDRAHVPWASHNTP